MPPHSHLPSPTDEDGSGSLEVDELQNAFQSRLGIHKTDDEIIDIFRQINGENANLESVDIEGFRKIVDYIRGAEKRANNKTKPPVEISRWEVPVSALRSGPQKVCARVWVCRAAPRSVHAALGACRKRCMPRSVHAAKGACRARCMPQKVHAGPAVPRRAAAAER